jgi:WD40 repeat protein
VDAKTKSDVVEFHGHTTVTNVVQWNPKNSNIFLSTSHDPEIRVFDIRSPSKPLQELSGHSQGNRLSGIYQPVFVNDGKSILAPGVGSSSQMLTMFDIASGDIVSCGEIGCAAGATFSTGNRCDPVIVSGSKRLSFLYPSRL